MSKLVRIFISSTWEDLQPERQVIETALHRMQVSFAGMEYFGSRPETPKEVSLAEVARSNVYIGIFAHRYGSGITEAEYDLAHELNIPCLIYFKDDKVPVAPSSIEKENDKVTKLNALKSKLKARHTISYFISSDHLATQVVADLHNLLENTLSKRKGASPEEGSVPYFSNASNREVVIDERGQRLQQFDFSITSQWTTSDLLRLQHLEDNVLKDLELIKQYEDALRLEDDPQRRAKYSRQIEQLQKSVNRYRQEYSDLQTKTPTRPPQQLKDVGVHLNEMDSKLDALLAGQTAIQADLSNQRSLMLSRFDVTEQGIIEALVKKLDQQQLAMTQAILDAIEAERIPNGDLQEALTVVQQVLADIQYGKVAPPDLFLSHIAERLSEVIEAPMLDVKHKLKVTVPIIPFLLSYEGEVGVQRDLNVKSVWEHLKNIARGTNG